MGGFPEVQSLWVLCTSPARMASVEEPKRPLSSYFIFLNDSRDALTKELGSDATKKGAVASLASKKWKELPGKDRKLFEQKAADNKKEYEKAIEAFKADGGEVGKRKAEKATKKAKRDAKRARKESGKPKKPPNAYQIFVNEIRPEIMKSLPAGSGVAAIGKEAGEKWKKVSEKDKEKYQQAYEKGKAAYVKELEAWKAANANKENAGNDDNNDEDAAEDDEDDEDEDEE